MTVSLRLPLPLAVQLPPMLAAQLQVAPVRVAGRVSVIVAPVTSDGPLLVTTTVYDVLLPGVAVVRLSVLVVVRSPVGVSVSVSVAELFAGVRSVAPVGTATVAVLASDPVALERTVAARVYVTVAPTGRLTVSLIDPVPDAEHNPPPAARQVQVALVSALGSESLTVAAVMAEGPRLLATIV